MKTLVALLAVLMMVAGCSDGAQESAENGSASSQTATTLEPTAASVSAAIEQLQVGSYRFEVRALVADSLNEQGTATASGWFAEGVAKDGWTSIEIDTSPGIAGPSMYQIAGPGDLYTYTPGVVDADDFTPIPTGAHTILPATEGWRYLDLDRVRSSEVLDGTDLSTYRVSSTFDSIAPMLEFISSIEEGPRATVQDVEMRSFAIELDLEAMRSNEAAVDLVPLLGDITLELFVDDDGNLRRVLQKSWPIMDQVDLFDFGADVSIDIPTDFNDITDDFIESR